MFKPLNVENESWKGLSIIGIKFVLIVRSWVVKKMPEIKEQYSLTTASTFIFPGSIAHFYIVYKNNTESAENFT